MDQALRHLFTKTSPWLFCLALFILSRLLFWQQAAFMAAALQPHLPVVQWFWQWDSAWYLRIIQHGYDVTPQPDTGGMANYVFFPMLPLIVGFLSKMTLIPVMWMGQIFAQLCLLTSLFLFYRVLILRIQDETAARFGVLLLAFSPCNIYFSSFYTESLFLVLSLGIWLAAYAQRWFLAGLLGALLSATRPTGVMMVIPLLFIAYELYQAGQLKWRFLWIALVPAGALAFMIYLHFHVGNAFAFIANDKLAWRRPGLNLLHPVMYGASFKAVFALVVSLYLIYRLIRAKYWPEALYFLTMIYPAIMSGSLTSFLRYSLCLFSFYFALVVISRGQAYFRWFIFSGFLVYTGIFVTLWITGSAMQ